MVLWPTGTKRGKKKGSQQNRASCFVSSYSLVSKKCWPQCCNVCWSFCVCVCLFANKNCYQLKPKHSFCCAHTNASGKSVGAHHTYRKQTQTLKQTEWSSGENDRENRHRHRRIVRICQQHPNRRNQCGGGTSTFAAAALISPFTAVSSPSWPALACHFDHAMSRQCVLFLSVSLWRGLPTRDWSRQVTETSRVLSVNVGVGSIHRKTFITCKVKRIFITCCKK